MKFVRKSPKFRIFSRWLVILINALNFYKDSPSQLRSELGDINKIALLESDRIGDAVWCVPIINKILNRYPHIDVTIITGKNGGKEIFTTLFPTLTCIEVALPWQNGNLFSLSSWNEFIVQSMAIKRSNSFDAVFDLRGDIRNIIFLRGFTPSRYFVSNSDADGCKLLTHEYSHFNTYPHMVLAKYACVKKFLGLDELLIKTASGKKISQNVKKIIVNPGASNAVRSMSKAEFDEIMRFCERFSIELSVLIPPGWDSNRIDFKEYDVEIVSLRLSQFFCVFPLTDTLYVGMDTGTSHLISYLEQRSLILHRYSDGHKQISPLNAAVVFAQSLDKKLNFESFFEK